MATREEVELLRGHLWKASPTSFFKALDHTQVGMYAILGLLYEVEEKMTAGTISEKMNVSTARIAVLLRKMSDKGLIKRESDKNDARVTVVSLTDKGREVAKERQTEEFNRIAMLIDQVGMEDMIEFTRISGKIKKLMKEYHQEGAEINEKDI